MQDNENRTGRGTGHIILYVCALVYFLCPAALYLPVHLLCGGNPPPKVQAAVEIFFWPVAQLADYVPLYGDLMARETVLEMNVSDSLLDGR